tara:strand:+ start:204 stop:464 length:261 start_codon:yes stop_codon:yes gene_type:complete
MLEERTADEIAKIYSASLHSVRLIETETSPLTGFSETEWKARIKRNVDHLVLIKGYTKLDGKTSIWTSEDFTAIDAAIVKGKKVYE